MTAHAHIQAARSYSRYAFALIRAGQPERAVWWRAVAWACLDDARRAKLAGLAA